MDILFTVTCEIDCIQVLCVKMFCTTVIPSVFVKLQFTNEVGPELECQLKQIFIFFISRETVYAFFFLFLQFILAVFWDVAYKKTLLTRIRCCTFDFDLRLS